MAARYGDRKTVKFLIEHVNALHGEDLERGIEAIKQILRRTTNVKETALHQHRNVVQLFIKEDPESPYLTNDAGETRLFLAVERAHQKVVSDILETCQSPYHDGPNGRTTLHVAVINGQEAMTQKILEVTGSTLTRKVDLQGWTPLHHAAYLCNLWMVGELLKHDKSAAYIADIDDKRTALHLAASCGHKDVLKELISCCPDCCELADKRGRNVLHVAVESKVEAAVKFILEDHSLSYLIIEKDIDGNTPLHLLAASLFNASSLMLDDRVDPLAMRKTRVHWTSVYQLTISHVQEVMLLFLGSST